MNSRCALTIFATFNAGCSETGQDHASVPLFVAGADVSEPVVAVGDILVTIDRADLAFGPLYLCAGVKAGDLCDTARLEWLGTVVVDTTNPDAEAAGALTGVTGPARSWMYDLGISSQLTRLTPFVLDAAKQLGDVSFLLEGRASVGEIELPFTASVPIQQTDDNELGIPVVRKSDTDSFYRDVSSDETGLVVRFDSAAWVRKMDFRPYVTSESCAEGSPSLVCDGMLERTCDGEAEISARDCSELGQICLPEQGCRDRLTLESDSEAYSALRIAITSGARPSFNWDYVP